MKKQLSKILAATLTCSMLLPATVFASAPTLSGNMPGPAVSGNDAVISGNGVVNTAPIRVMLPSNLNFAVDKYQIADKEQIYGVDYPIVNASDFPVRVDVDVLASGKDGTTLVNDTDPKLAAREGGKTYFLRALIPDEITVASGVSANGVSDNTISANGTTVSECTVIPVSNTPASFSFALDKYVSTNSVVSANAATFTFGGKVNSYAKWGDSDLSVAARFSLSGLSNADYADLPIVSDNNTLNVGLDAKSYTVAVGSTLTVKPKLEDATTAITKAVIEVNANGTWMALGGEYNDSAKTITLAMPNEAPKGSFPMRVIINDSITYYADLVIG